MIDYFVQYYGGADNKQGLRPLVDAIEQCDTLLRYETIVTNLGSSLSWSWPPKAFMGLATSSS